MISMKKVILVVAIATAMFPYTQIVSSDAYTQPYAVIFAAVATIFCLRSFLERGPGWEVLSLIGLAFVGTIVFLVSSLPSPVSQDFKSLLMYLSPLVFSVCAFTLSNSDLSTMRRIVSVAALTWLCVGIVQSLFDPTFATRWVGEWSGAANVVLASGRGVIGLAPEPVHHGFHMLLLAATLYLVKGNRYLIGACMMAPVLLAQSSSAILAMLLAAGVLVAFHPVRLLVPISVALFIMVVALGWWQDQSVQQTVRVAVLAGSFMDDPTAVLTVDHSVNTRVGGVIVGMGLILDGWLLPHGMSNADWIARIPQTLVANPWLFDISSSGIPSGILIVVYQLGWIGLLLLVVLFRRIYLAARSFMGLWLLFGALAVFLGQFLISTPAFGILHGCALAATMRKRLTRVVPITNLSKTI